MVKTLLRLVRICIQMSCLMAFSNLPRNTSLLKSTMHLSKDSFTDTASTQLDFTIHKVRLRKPMGIILESDDEDPTSGVIIKRIDPMGQTAAACRTDPVGVDICIRDRILQINDMEVKDESLESIMKIIMDGPEMIDLVLGRSKDAIVLKWWNGISVATKPGEKIRNIAASEACVRVNYSCDSGGCGTCELSISHNGTDGEERYFRPCIARVPKGRDVIWVSPSNRYEPFN